MNIGTKTIRIAAIVFLMASFISATGCKTQTKHVAENDNRVEASAPQAPASAPVVTVAPAESDEEVQGASDSDVPETRGALESLKAFDAAFAAGRNYYKSPGVVFDETKKFGGRYPIFIDFTCEFDVEDTATCYVGANTPINKKDFIDDMPYILNADIESGMGGKLRCDGTFCTNPEGHPIGRMQKNIRSDWEENYRHFGNGQYAFEF